MDVTDIRKALKADLAEQAGRVIQTAVRTGFKIPDEDEAVGFTRIELSPRDELRSGPNPSVIIPARFGSDPALFDIASGGFQLGSYLKIENEGLRLLVDIVADPLNLVGVGTLTKLTKVGAVGRLVSAGLNAAGKSKNIKTIGEAFQGVENVIKIAGGGPEYLQRLRAAAESGGFGSRAFKRVIDEGLSNANLTDEARDLLTVLRKDRKAFVDLKMLSEKMGQRALDASAVLQPTRAGRLGAQQVRPLLYIEKPFAFTRALVGVPYADSTAYIPATLNALAGKAGDAFTKTFRSSSLTNRLSKVAPDDLLLDGGGDLIFNRAGALLQADLKLVRELNGAVVEDPSAPLQAQLGLDAITDAEWRDLTRGLRRFNGGQLRVDEVRSMLAQQAAKRSLLDDTAAVKAAEQAANQRLELIRKAARESGERRASLGLIEESEAAINGYVAEMERQARMIYATRSMESLLGDDAAALAIESQISVQRVASKMQAEIMGEVIERSVGGRKAGKAREFFRMMLRHPIDAPDAFRRDDVTGIYHLVTGDDLVAAKRKYPELERTLKVGAADFPDIEKRLQTEGLAGGLSIVSDTMRSVTEGMSRRLLDEQLIKEVESNYFRRSIKPRGGRDMEDLVRTFRADLNNPDNARFARAYERARDAVREGKSLESVQIARRATEETLIEMEKAGLITIQRDSIAAFQDGIDSTFRAVLMRDFMAAIERQRPYLTRELVERMNDHADIEWLPDFLKTGQRRIRPEEIPERGLPEAIPFGAKESQPWDLANIDEDLFNRLYVKVTVPQEFARLGPLRDIEAEGWRALSGGGRITRDTARRRVVARLNDSAAFREKVLGSKSPRFKDGEELTADDFVALASGKSPKALKSVTAKKARRSVQDAIEREMKTVVKKATERLDEAPESGFYVLRGQEGKLREAFSLFERGDIANGAWRWLLAKNRLAKAAILNLSYFHYNTVQMAGMLANPVEQVQMLMSPLARSYRREFLVKSGAGAAVGAAAGGAMGQDQEAAVGGGLMGLLWMTGIGAASVNAKVAKKFMLHPEMLNTYFRMGRAGWSGRPDDRAIGLVAGWLKRTADNLKAKHGANLRGSMAHSLFAGQAYHERALWDFAHNGQKTLYYHHAFARIDNDLEKRVARGDFTRGSKAFERAQRRMDREVTQVANSAFGGHNASRLFSDPRWMQHSQGLLLSPDWTKGNVIGAGNIFLNNSIAKNAAMGALLGQAAEFVDAGFDLDHVTGKGALGGAAVGVGIGALSKRAMARFLGEGSVAKRESIRLYTNAVLAIYAFGNLANYAATGHFMFDNPEGKKLSVALPGGKDYIAFGKPYFETLEFASAIDPEKFKRPIIDRAASKASPAVQFFVQFLSGRDSFGGHIVKVTDNPLEGAYNSATHALGHVTPIVIQRPLRSLRRIATDPEVSAPAELARGLLSAAGFALSSPRGVGGGDVDAALGALYGNVDSTLSGRSFGDTLFGR